MDQINRFKTSRNHRTSGCALTGRLVAFIGVTPGTSLQIVIGPAVRPPEVTEAKALEFQGRGPTISSRRHSDHFRSRRRLDDKLIDGVALAILRLILLVFSSAASNTARSCQS